MTRCRIALATGIALFGCGLSVAHAQGVEREAWTTKCGEGDRCTALLAVSDNATQRPIASIGIQVGPDAADPAMIAFLPLGVELKPGFRAVVDDRAFPAPYEVCYPDGCRAVAPISPQDLDLWLKAKTVSLQFFPFGSDKPVSACRSRGCAKRWRRVWDPISRSMRRQS